MTSHADVLPAGRTVPSESPSARPWPWYRREPWFATMLLAFVPLAVGFALPESTHVLLFAVSALLALTSVAMLLRQGVFRAHHADQ